MNQDEFDFYSRASIRLMDAHIIAERQKAQKKSVAFFTTHKCASTLMAELLDLIAQIGHYGFYDYMKEAYIIKGKLQIDHDTTLVVENSHRLFHEFGEFYGPLRSPVAFPSLDRVQQIYFLRDPRDILVSAFYSYGYTHSLPPEQNLHADFLAFMQSVRDQGIDQFCLSQAENWILPTYTKYMEMRKAAEDSLYLPYDLFKDTPKQFLVQISAFLGINILANLDLASFERAVAPPKQDHGEMRHRRSGKSRQFETELQPETVAQLNACLKDVLTYWEFDL